MCLGSGAAKRTWLCDGCRTQRWLRATASPSRGTVSPPEPQSGPSSCPGLGTSRGEGALQPTPSAPLAVFTELPAETPGHRAGGHGAGSPTSCSMSPRALQIFIA